MRRTALLLAASVALALIVPSTATATCGAEGCPCVPNGLSGSRFAFDVRTLDVTQDQLWQGGQAVSLQSAIGSTTVHHGVPLLTRTRTWSFEGRMQVNDRVRVSASLPYLDREHRRFDAHTTLYDEALIQSWRFKGLGDATALVHVKAYEPFGGPRVSVRAGAKLPTGRTQVPLGNGLIPSEIQPVLRPGSGSWDLMAGASLSQRLPWDPVMPLGLDVQRRWNGKGTEDYRAGDELQANLSSGWVVRPGFAITALANYAQHGGDSWTAPTASDPYRHPAHGGSRGLYLTPGANVSLPGGLGLYAAWQNRVWGTSGHAEVVARNYLLLGLSYSQRN